MRPMSPKRLRRLYALHVTLGAVNAVVLLIQMAVGNTGAALFAMVVIAVAAHGAETTRRAARLRGDDLDGTPH